MKHYAKILPLFLALILILSLSACGDSALVPDPGLSDESSAPVDENSQSPSPSPSDDPIQSESPSDDPVESETPSDDPVESETPSDDPVETETPSSNVTEVLEDGRPWYLVLTNPTHYLSEDYVFETKALPNGLLVDERVYDALMQMLSDCQADGLSPIVCSAYRTIEKQTSLFQRKIDKYLADGLSYEEAYAAAAQVVAVPGTSEHHTGMAVDLVALSYQVLDTAQESTAEQQWLMAHCHEYGFILRYPNGTTDITGIIYEPWHYRYVGVEAATEIMTRGITLEEYLAEHYNVE